MALPNPKAYEMNAAGEQSYKNEVDRYNQANPNSKVNYTPRATYNTAATVTQQNGAYNVGDRQFQNQQSAQDWASTQGMTPQAELNVTPPVSALEQHVTEVQKTAQQEAADKVQGDYYKMYQTGEDLVARGILKTNPYPQTYDEYLKNQSAQSQQQIDYQTKQNQIASTLDQNELARAKEQGAASIAGVTAAMAQGREGVMGTSKPLAAQGFKTTTEKVIGDATLRVQSAENARAQALKNLEQAQTSGNENMIKVYSGQLANAEEEIRKSKIDLMDAETKAATAAASIAQSQANTAKIKTETLQSTFEAMGESAANLDVNSLVSMADNAGLSYGQVAAMRDMSVLTAQLGKAKSQGEIAQISANIARIQKDTELAGKPAAALEYEYFSQLTPGQQKEYTKLKAGNDNVQLIKDEENGGWLAYNKTTGTVRRVNAPVDTNAANLDDTEVKDIFYQSGKSDYGWGDGKRECGEGYNDITDGPKVGDGYDKGPNNKMSTVTKRDNPEVGNGLVLPLRVKGGALTNGHIETVISSDGENIKTISWNRNGDGSPSVENYNVLELKQKYGDNWGFNDSKLKQQYVDKLSVKVDSTKNKAVMDGLSALAASASSKFAYDAINNSIKNYLKSGEIDKAKNLILTAAGNSLEATAKQDFKGSQLTLGLLDGIEADLLALKDKGVDTGFLKGTEEQVLNKIGKTSDKDVAKLQTKIFSAIQRYRKSITGAGFAESETAEYNKIFPGVGKGQELNAANIDGLREVLSANVDGYYSQVLGDDVYQNLKGGSKTLQSSSGTDWKAGAQQGFGGMFENIFNQYGVSNSSSMGADDILSKYKIK